MREKLGTLDAERRAIRGELDEITGAREELRRLASQRDDLLAASYNGLFDKFVSHTPEDRREAYRKIGLTVLVAIVMATSRLREHLSVLVAGDLLIPEERHRHHERPSICHAPALPRLSREC